MKKIMFIALFVALCATATAQIEGELRATAALTMNHFAEKTGGYSMVEPYVDLGENRILSVLGLPSYYTFDLLRLDVSNFYNSYSDLYLVQTWTPQELGYTYSLLLGEDWLIFFYYFTEPVTVLGVDVYNGMGITIRYLN